MARHDERGGNPRNRGQFSRKLRALPHPVTVPAGVPPLPSPSEPCLVDIPAGPLPTNPAFRDPADWGVYIAWHLMRRLSINERAMLQYADGGEYGARLELADGQGKLPSWEPDTKMIDLLRRPYAHPHDDDDGSAGDLFDSLQRFQVRMSAIVNRAAAYYKARGLWPVSLPFCDGDSRCPDFDALDDLKPDFGIGNLAHEMYGGVTAGAGITAEEMTLEVGVAFEDPETEEGIADGACDGAAMLADSRLGDGFWRAVEQRFLGEAGGDAAKVMRELVGDRHKHELDIAGSEQEIIDDLSERLVDNRSRQYGWNGYGY